MKPILKPIFQLLFATIIMAFTFTTFIIANIISIFWKFRLLKWYELLNNCTTIGYRLGYENTEYDLNIKETWIRYYNFEISCFKHSIEDEPVEYLEENATYKMMWED